jgi:predicted S18 family serine protease
MDADDRQYARQLVDAVEALTEEDAAYMFELREPEVPKPAVCLAIMRTRAAVLRKLLDDPDYFKHPETTGV